MVSRAAQDNRRERGPVRLPVPRGRDHLRHSHKQTWALVVGDNVYVRAANGQESRWYRAAVTQKAERVRVRGTYHDVTFEAAGTTDEAAIDAAYEVKYLGSSAVPIMQGDGPKSASARISPR